MTSKMPSQTGVVSTKHYLLKPSHLTLAETIQAAGWRTASVTANYLLTGRAGFDQGFDQLIEIPPPITSYLDSGERVNQRVMKWLEENGDDRFFMYVMYMDTHEGYLPPLSFMKDRTLKTWITETLPALKTYLINALIPRRILFKPEYVESYRQLYMDEVHYWDYCIGELMDFLEARGLMDNTLIIITTDHGEEFLDHGLFIHGTSLYEELIHVPLIIVDGASTRSGCEVNLNTRHLDLAPTILDYLGIKVPPEFNGLSLLPLGEQPSPDRPRTVWSELPVAYPPSMFIEVPRKGGPRQGMRAIIRGNLKLIETFEFPSGLPISTEAYDLVKDPHEKTSLDWEKFPELSVMKDDLDRYFREMPGKVSLQSMGEQDQEMIKRLRSLGYIR